jgi:hypothetical protein
MLNLYILRIKEINIKAFTDQEVKVEQELRMLSALHGIGVILLNVENPINFLSHKRYSFECDKNYK